ncbi:hypothetical protein [Ensifer adhaerens]|uniref:hypothetical protein n=1 Tax=Ensifer adhaerens TaxID=106592 RepID=UPI000FDC3DD5|nr:hypothetical protein [Ensifer adhaerens]MDF8359002.1 hypothetical protein [Ensifer adhaerens]THA68368.1 hypothetical protein E5176_05085 [Ensifer adhaerens]
MAKLRTASAQITSPGPQGYVEYEVDIETVLRSDLPRLVSKIPLAPLTAEAIGQLPEGAKGAYVLFMDGHPVYAGKTDVRHGFRDRLSRHAFTIQNRENLDPSRIGFKAIRILVFSNFDVEAILIDALTDADETALAWNYRGFGSNDPGQNREGQEPAEFDVEFPINIDRKLDLLEPGAYDLLTILVQLKQHVPFYFRYQTDHPPGKKRPVHFKKGHADQRSAAPVVVDAGDTLRVLLKKMLLALPAGWRVTHFPGRVILYKNDKIYDHALEAFTAQSISGDGA